MLRVSDNRRFLVRDDGAPFFYLGDTAWALFQRLDLAEAARYLEDRAAKGFTVIQAVALSEFDGLRAPNRYGDLPLHDGDPLRPNEAYFRHVDAVIDIASWTVPGIFQILQRDEKVNREEMYQVFNMGIGMVAVVAERDAKQIARALKAKTIGRIERGRGITRLSF